MRNFSHLNKQTAPEAGKQLSTGQFNRESGFTLLDLSIAVAILSVMATLAMSNFQNYVARAKQAEAKRNLASLFAAEKAFHSEWGAYTGDFRDLGLEVSGSTLRYNFGFATAGAPVGGNFVPSSIGGCAVGSASNTSSSCALTTATSSAATVAFSAAPAAGGCGAGEDPSGSSYRASAVGSLGGGTPDIWTMDEGNHLCNNQHGSMGGTAVAAGGGGGAGGPGAAAAATGGATLPTPIP